MVSVIGLRVGEMNDEAIVRQARVCERVCVGRGSINDSGVNRLVLEVMIAMVLGEGWFVLGVVTINFVRVAADQICVWSREVPADNR